jgi:hypothetical protein
VKKPCLLWSKMQEFEDQNEKRNGVENGISVTEGVGVKLKVSV